MPSPCSNSLEVQVSQDILQASQVAIASIDNAGVRLQIHWPRSENRESLRFIHHHQHEQNFLLRGNAHFVPVRWVEAELEVFTLETIIEWSLRILIVHNLRLTPVDSRVGHECIGVKVESSRKRMNLHEFSTWLQGPRYHLSPWVLVQPQLTMVYTYWLR